MNPVSLGFPDEETMTCDQVFVENHFYMDLRHYDLSDFESILSDEEDLLLFEGDLDELEDNEFDDNEVFCLGLDPGVASSAIALAALGACPVSSCSGGDGHSETHPLK